MTARQPAADEHGFGPLRRSAEHGFTPSRRSAERGFTLVEVMISLLIFGMLAAAGVSLLAFSVRAQAATGLKLDDATATNRLVAALDADLAQVMQRRPRGEGGEPQPAFFGARGSDTDTMLRLVRGGWTNVDAAPRPSEQKVDWRFVDGAIIRQPYRMLDGAPPMPSAPLIDHVRQVTLRYRYAGAWSERWDESAPAPLPDAIELRLVRDDGRQLRALFLVGSGAGNVPRPEPSRAA